jgi:glycosyltransferase involved in cell wall biosynthesis
MNDKSIIIITGNFFFPDKNAAGKYNLSYGLMLRDMGYKVVFIGTNQNVDYRDKIENTYENLFGMESYSMPYPRKRIDWIKYNSQFERVIEIVNIYGKDKIRAIIAFGNPSIALWSYKLYRYAKKSRIAFIAHCAENVRFTKRGFIYSVIRGLDDMFKIHLIIPKAKGVIVGGPLLEKYFIKRHCNTIVFPTLNDTEPYRSHINEVLNSNLYSKSDQIRTKRFIYVGNPFDLKSKNNRKDFKDRLDKTIELFYKVFQNDQRFCFDIFGLSAEDYIQHVPEHKDLINELKNNICFHGKVDFNIAVEKIINSDFYIFHRDITNITQAAFPTKASEAISLAVPLITNNTSYIFDYVLNGFTGFMINEENEVETIINLIKLTNFEVLALRKNCFDDRTFDYRKSIPKFQTFIEKIINGNEGSN